MTAAFMVGFFVGAIAVMMVTWWIEDGLDRDIRRSELEKAFDLALGEDDA